MNNDGSIDSFYKFFSNEFGIWIPTATFALETDSSGNIYFGVFFMYGNLRIAKMSIVTR